MRLTLLIAGIIAFALSSCEKKPQTENESLNVTFRELNDKPLLDLYEGLYIKLVSEDFKKFAEQQIDLKKEGVVLFDKVIAPIDSVGSDFIITRVPLMNYITPLNLPISIRISNQSIPVCNACLVYRPTVRGRILTGYAGGGPDGRFQMPAEITLDLARNIYVIDQRALHDIVLKVTPTGEVSTFAGAAGEFGRLVGIGINSSTNKMYLADATAQRVFELDMFSPTSVTILAGSGIAGNIDGIGTAASFNFGNQWVYDNGSNERAQGLALDAAGNIYVSDKNLTSTGSQIRRITPTGVVAVVSGSRIDPAAPEDVAIPAGLVLSATNDIWYVSGNSSIFQGVTRVNADGTRSRVAGSFSREVLNDGTGTVAAFDCPKAIATNGTYFYVADGTNGALRRVSSTGQVITLAGVGHNHTQRFSTALLPPLEGDWLMENPYLLVSPDYFEIAAAAIRMDQVGGVAVTHGGRTIYVSDHGYRCIWKITIG